MALIIQSSFRTQAPIDVVWRVLTNIEVAAPCFPGAQLGDKLEDGSYKGSFNVKLGPMSFLFAGKFGFVSLDPQTHHAKINASGSDTKGRGGAQALVDVQLTQEKTQTLVEIVSDASLSGAVAHDLFAQSEDFLSDIFGHNNGFDSRELGHKGEGGFFLS